MAIADKVVVRLDSAQRQSLDAFVRTGEHAAAMIRRAHILLKADADGPDAWPDERIAEAFDTTRMTVRRVRQQFADEGLDATLRRKRPTGRQYRKLDGEQEARRGASRSPARRRPKVAHGGRWCCCPSGSWS